MLRRRVLLVDDYVSAANATAQLLRVAGHTVIIAYDADRVVPIATDFQPDAIFLDIGLPGDTDGVGLARRLRAHPSLRGTTLIALTGYDAPEERIRIRNAGFDHYLLKPVGLEVLESIIEQSGSRLPDERSREVPKGNSLTR
jgi:two-component system, chemotaxis family, CheB/CheR fusion protein